MEFVLAELKDPEYPLQDKKRLFESAIAKFRQVCQSEPWNTDAQFNLAQVIHAYVGLSIDLGETLPTWEQDLMECLRVLDKCLETSAQIESQLGSSSHGNSMDTDDDQTDMGSSKVDPWEVSALKVEILTTMMETSVQLDKIQNYFDQASAVLSRAEALPTLDNKEMHLKLSSIYHTLGFKAFELSKRVNQEHFKTALGHLDAILAQEPGCVEALCDKGDTLISFAEVHNETDSRPLFAAASAAFTEALKIEPSNPNILLKLGDVNLSRIRLYSDPQLDQTRQILGKNAKLYYEKAYPLKKHTMERKWVLFHLVKANSYIPGCEGECLRVWSALAAEGATIEVLGADDDVSGVPFGPCFTLPSGASP